MMEDTDRSFNSQVFTTVDRGADRDEVLGARIGAHGLEGNAFHTCYKLVLRKFIAVRFQGHAS